MQKPSKILIINADDFGMSPAVNAAVLRAHLEGVLTSTSLMVNGRAFNDAVRMAGDHPDLGVGIHVTLGRGKSTLSQAEIPRLVDPTGSLPDSPTLAGLRYFFSRGVRTQLGKEIEAQIQKFLDTGLVPSHVDGHLHLHVHPTILSILLPLAERYAIPAFRLPRESLKVNLKLNRRKMGMKVLYTLIYRGLCAHAVKALFTRRIRFPDRFFGLLASGEMDEPYLLGVVESLEAGVTEIGTHPALGSGPEQERWAPHYRYREEFNALLSPKVKDAIQSRGIRLANYHALASPRHLPGC
jgi:hopanoid biosynthesis associated protein HpnK